MIQSALVTPTATAWASMALTVPEADLAVEDFLNIIEDKQALWEQEDEKNKNLPSAIATTTLGNIEGSIPGGSVMNPSQNESNRMHMTSVLRKRKIKMRKHKYKKLRKRTRALRKKLGK
ncbi:hypothetical protein FBU30_001144 [Linnemannia zychae]|nr:hypothetical protein FBU30_001144 [Linnemannia zychae]